MQRRIIRFSYRKIIDSSSQRPWEKLLFNDTYTEFRMQAQYYDREKKFTSFSELLSNVPAADNLHFLVSSSASGYLKQLNGIIPDIQNASGKHFLKFKNYRFEIIDSDVENKIMHRVVVTFYSEPLEWHDTIDKMLLISEKNNVNDNGDTLTELVVMQPFLSIYSLNMNENAETVKK